MNIINIGYKRKIQILLLTLEKPTIQNNCWFLGVRVHVSQIAFYWNKKMVKCELWYLPFETLASFLNIYLTKKGIFFNS